MSILTLILILILSIFVVLSFHELGHLIAGLIQGFRFELFVVGPLGIKRENNKIKIYVNTNPSYYWGVTATMPNDGHPVNAQKFARVLLAGPMASLFLAMIGLLAFSFVSKPFDLIFFSLGALSLTTFFVTTLPSKAGMFFTDRKRYQRLVRPGKDQEVELALFRILGKYSKDESYKNLDIKDIKILIQEDSTFFHYYGLFCMKAYLIENEKDISAEFEQQYSGASKMISKRMLVIFDNELRKLNKDCAANVNGK